LQQTYCSLIACTPTPAMHITSFFVCLGLASSAVAMPANVPRAANATIAQYSAMSPSSPSPASTSVMSSGGQGMSSKPTTASQAHGSYAPAPSDWTWPHDTTWSHQHTSSSQTWSEWAPQQKRTASPSHPSDAPAPSGWISYHNTTTSQPRPQVHQCTVL
jgi:hypothetical protein